MSRLSHKHYLLLLCLRAGPTSGAKIACLLVSPTAYCERGGMRRQCWVALNHFEVVTLVKERRRGDVKHQGTRNREQVAEEDGSTPLQKAISRIPWNQLHIEGMSTLQRSFDSSSLSYSPGPHSPCFCSALKLNDGTFIDHCKSAPWLWGKAQWPLKDTQGALGLLWAHRVPHWWLTQRPLNHSHKEKANIPFSF